MTGEVYIGGHSLGAARAFLYAYSRIKRGLRVDGIYALASPHPGDKAIGQILFAARANFQAVRSLKNRRDFVLRVPEPIAFIGEEYYQSWQLDEINETVDMSFGLDPDHHIANYVAGAHKVPDNPSAAIKLGDAADQIERLYTDATNWDWINAANGAYSSMKVMPSGARLAIFRGTASFLEWLQDFDAVQETVLGAKVSTGFWSGVAAVQDQLDAQLA